MVTILPPDQEPPVADAGPDQTVITWESVSLAGTATDNDPAFPTGATWQWTIDLPATPIVLEGQERSYSFGAAGVYSVTLSVSDYWGNIGQDTLVVTVVEPDTEAPLVPQPPDIETLVGDPVTFRANATDDSADFDLTGNITWRFTGGGEQVALYGETVTYTFDRAGVFAVTLAVLDGSGNRAAVRTFSVRVGAPDATPPEVTASADRTDVTVGTRVKLTGIATDAGVTLIDDALFEWRFTYDGSVKTLAGRSASFVFERAGTYVVELSVRDANGNVGTASVTVTVREAPLVGAGGGVDALLVGGLLAAAAAAAVAFVVLRARKRAGGKSPGASDARRTAGGGSGRPSQPKRVAARSLGVRSADERKTRDESGRPPGRV
jgi:PKD repeat protein